MALQVSFRFSPNEMVKIIVGGLNCEGRVIRCIKTDGEMNVYDCDYYMNSEIKHRQFYEDEIAGVSDDK